MSRVRPTIYTLLAQHHRQRTVPTTPVSLLASPDAFSTLILVTPDDPKKHHARISLSPNGLIGYRQKDARNTPTGRTHNWKSDQPVLTLQQAAQQCLDMLLDSLAAHLPKKLRADPEANRQELQFLLTRTLTNSNVNPLHYRHLVRRVQRHFTRKFASNQDALEILQETMNQAHPPETWTVNQYNAALAIPALIRQAHRTLPHVLATYLTHTVNIRPTPDPEYPASLQEMAQQTGWASITRQVRTRPENASNNRLRVAASAIRDAHVPDHCTLAAEAIWASTQLHWELRELEGQHPGTWNRWTQLLRAALHSHPKETQLHRESQPRYQETVATGSAKDRQAIAGRTSCLALAAHAITAGERLLHRTRKPDPWPGHAWEEYLLSLPFTPSA